MSLYVCMHIHMCLWNYVCHCMCACTFTCVSGTMCVTVCVHAHSHVSLELCVSLYVCMHIHMCLWNYVCHCMCACRDVCLCVCENIGIHFHHIFFSVESLITAPVNSYSQIDNRIQEGTRNRTVASTNMNATSRSAWKHPN